MRWFWVLWLGLGLAQAQGDNLAALERCQGLFAQLKPQVLYLERSQTERFWIRLLLEAEGQPLVRLTLSSLLQPVPLGLEDIALQAVRPAQDRTRWLGLLRRRFEGLTQALSLGNWTVAEAKGYRCFVTYQGRVVGILRLDLDLKPRTDARWFNAYRRSPLRFPDPTPALR